MCGIFGVVSSEEKPASLTLDGLRVLEYRGYDSWGIAVKRGKKIESEKHIGKIGDAKTTLPNSTISIGHTRWGTHGRVTQANAHPHTDCKKQIAVVHNGIVENFEVLKQELIKKGHRFISETDTEIFAHLIEENLKTKGFATSIKDAFNRVEGLNAFVVAYAPSQEIIACKTGSPLVVGVGESEYFVASDAAGIVKHTRHVLFLEDNQMVILGKQMKLLQLPLGNELKISLQKLDWEFVNETKGNFPHFLLKEIHEQPAVIKNIAFSYSHQIKQLSTLIDNAFGTFMLGCGTASYAALAGTYLFSSLAKKHVNFSIGSEFKYLEDYIAKKTLVIPISQSGETIDVVEPVAKAKQKGAKIAALVNVLGSTLYRQADYKILLGAGQEKAVIATKSFMAMFSVLFLTACALSKNKKNGETLLLKAAENIERILRDQKQIKTLAQKLTKKEHIYILGRGLSYAAAQEATLKIKETSYIHAEGFAGGELKHGVIALIEKDTPCIIFAPNDETYDEIISNAQEVKARGGFIIGIGPKNNSVFDVFLETADVEHATLLPQVAIAQLLAYYCALAKGIKDPDKPRNLAKSVTVK